MAASRKRLAVLGQLIGESLDVRQVDETFIRSRCWQKLGSFSIDVALDAVLLESHRAHVDTWTEDLGFVVATAVENTLSETHSNTRTETDNPDAQEVKTLCSNRRRASVCPTLGQRLDKQSQRWNDDPTWQARDMPHVHEANVRWICLLTQPSSLC